MGSRTSTLSQKNTTVINIARSRALSRVSIGLSCTVSEIQNTGHSRCISPCCEQSRVSIGFSCTISEIQILANPNVLAHVAPRVMFRLILRAPSRKFKILAIPNVLAHGKSYEYGFTKKHDGHKLCAESSFDRFFVHSQKFIILVIPVLLSHGIVKFRSVFRALSRKYKIQANPNVLAHVHGKSYEHSFMKKSDGPKLSAKSTTDSSLDQFFVHRIGNSKYWPFPTY
ncbi:hypothetical protein BHE74_00051354 [Ensete ventricosum]|nr:hypothetical protein BHE74_00051354 [Ensete ventricosum]